MRYNTKLIRLQRVLVSNLAPVTLQGLRASVSFLTPDKYVHHTYGDLAFDKVNYLSPRYLRQQTPNTISQAHTPLFLLQRRVNNPRANRTRLPELDQEVVKA